MGLQGGTSTGRGVNDTCDVEVGRFGRPLVRLGDDLSPTRRSTEPLLTTLRGLATYTVPVVDVLVSAIFRSQPNAQPGGAVATNGGSRSANFQMNAAQFLAATGRSLRPGPNTQTVDLLRPGDVYGDRINSVDMPFAKILRFRGTRTNIGVDVYNVNNANTPTAYDQVYDPANPARWLRPTTVLLPRFVRFNAQFDF